MKWRSIEVHLHADGHRLTSRGLTANELGRVSKAIRLAAGSAERIRAYVSECCGVWPTVTGKARSVPPMPPPSGPMVAGD